MITTNNFEIKKTQNLTSSYIENELNLMGIRPLRWAIVNVCEDSYSVSVSYESS